MHPLCYCQKNNYLIQYSNPCVIKELELSVHLAKGELGTVDLPQQQIQSSLQEREDLETSEVDRDSIACIPTEIWIPLLGHSDDEGTCADTPGIDSEAL